MPKPVSSSGRAFRILDKRVRFFEKASKKPFGLFPRRRFHSATRMILNTDGTGDPNKDPMARVLDVLAKEDPTKELRTDLFNRLAKIAENFSEKWSKNIEIEPSKARKKGTTMARIDRYSRLAKDLENILKEPEERETDPSAESGEFFSPPFPPSPGESQRSSKPSILERLLSDPAGRDFLRSIIPDVARKLARDLAKEGDLDLEIES